LLELGVEIQVSQQLVEVKAGRAIVANVYSDSLQQEIEFDTLVTITARLPEDELYRRLQQYREHFKTLRAIGDCHAPGSVAAAVYDGHSAARHLESGKDIYAPLFNRELPALG
ncbi:MAG TPA: NADH:flavin oxidoreductase, partial [Gammaproteobacteria bacterium]